MIRIVPSGGWRFPSDGNLESSAELHEEPGYEELVQWLKGYRIANGKETGDPAHDINIFVARNNPRQRGEVPEPNPYAPTVVIPKTFREEVTNWLSDRFLGATVTPPEIVPVEEAETRAQICADCPNNQVWKTGCPPCVENAERIVVMFTQGRKTSCDSKLGACQVTKQSNQVAVNFGAKHLQYDEATKNKLPSFCWLNAV